MGTFSVKALSKTKVFCFFFSKRKRFLYALLSYCSSVTCSSQSTGDPFSFS
jgi:hypothetical protein